MRRTIALALIGGVAGILGGCHWYWRDCDPSPCGHRHRDRHTVSYRTSSDHWPSTDGVSRSGSRSESQSRSTTPGRIEPDRPKGNNGVGNGLDPQPPGNPPQNDGPGTSPGNPGNKQLKGKPKH